MTSKRDLALAYSPGVAAPVKAISKNPDLAYDYTTKGNLVAVISNGSAILGLGNLGAVASKPVMEGKAVLFKRFADIDSIDIEIDSSDTREIINSVKNISKSFGGINLEDIKAPECFIIENELKKLLDIPVFHDDQHGTAIITSAALINACDIAKKNIKDVKVVINGAGASAMACANLFINTGVKDKNITMLDSKGVIHSERDNLNEWKKKFAIKTKNRALNDAINGADVFLGLPYDLAMYGLLLLMLAKGSGYEPGKLICFLGDCHLYSNHIKQATQYLNRADSKLPTVELKKGLSLTHEVDIPEHKDITLINYNPATVIKAPLAT